MTEEDRERSICGLRRRKERASSSSTWCQSRVGVAKSTNVRRRAIIDEGDSPPRANISYMSN